MTTFRYHRGSDEDLIALRARMPEVTIVDKRPNAGAWWLDIVLAWLFTFGLWPLMDPGHDADTVASVIDITLHYSALAWLVVRWKVERR